MAKVQSSAFTFREYDTIGDLDGERDQKNLNDCFVDPGALDVLRDCSAPPRILVGRTGAGKTALLYKIRQMEEKVTEFNPETLSLNYISNSTILPFLFELGVNLDFFFDLLWRHVLATELIRQRYNIKDANQQQTALANLIDRFSRDDSKTKALDYLRRWGDKFWVDADERVKEITDRLEKAIQLQAGAGTPLSRASLESQIKFGEEEKREIVKRCQYVLNQVQASDLAGIVDLMQACLSDEQQRYFVLVDKLDEGWVDNSYKAALIRGLMRSVRAFAKVRSAKIIVALRFDLLERVFEDENLTTQREKYENLFFHVRWTRQQLTRALDERVNKLVRSRYTASQRVTHRDVMITSMGSKKGPTSLDYILDRTLMRPRDLLAFFNECIQEAGEIPKITADTIRSAERRYSQSRLDALDWEWKLTFPNLTTAARLVLANGPSHFAVSDLSELECISWAGSLKKSKNADPFVRIASEYNDDGDCTKFRRSLMWHLYYVGLLGLKVSRATPYEFATDRSARLSIHEIEEDTRVTVHQCFWRALGIRDAAFPSQSTGAA